MEGTMEKLADLKSATAFYGTSDRVVNVTVSAKTAFDLDAIQQVERSLFEILGHSMCYSGWDIRFDLQRDYYVNDALELILVLDEAGIGAGRG
jgi:hypothetical protein